MVFWENAYYAIAWFVNGKYNGYCKRIDTDTWDVNLEGLFENDKFSRFDNEVKKNSKNEIDSDYIKQKKLMKNHKDEYFIQMP